MNRIMTVLLFSYSAACFLVRPYGIDLHWSVRAAFAASMIALAALTAADRRKTP